MKIKKLLFILPLVLVLLSLSLSKEVQASTTGTVAATVTVQNVAISVTDGTIAYGTLAADASISTLVSPGVADQQTATNDGNVAEDFTIKGSNSAGWTLASTNTASDTYIHKFCIATCGTDAAPGAGFTVLTLIDQSLAAGVAAAGTQTFDLRVTTPQTSTVFTSQSVNVTVTAAAS